MGWGFHWDVEWGVLEWNVDQKVWEGGEGEQVREQEGRGVVD